MESHERAREADQEPGQAMPQATEDRLLATAPYQRRAAIGLCRGALRFLGRPSSVCR